MLKKKCETTHFKLESIKQVIHLIKSNTYLESPDIKDAFYIVPICEPHIKYLKFVWLNKAYQFIVMPDGYVNAMRVFSNPVDIYLFKVNNRNTRTRCEYVQIKQRHQNDAIGVVLVSLLLTFNIFHTLF